MKTKVSCSHCNAVFEKEAKIVKYYKKQNYKYFCSTKCNLDSKKMGNDKKCSHCGKDVYVTSSMAKNSKSNRFFCSRSCSASFNNKHYRTGINHPNYKGGKWSYRRKALEFYNKKCSICGYAVVKVLQVHHRDCDRKNNDIKNLDVLCPTHHKEFHVGILKY